ncbi:D-alanyl-D-alanine carboxypeptidase family protein [Microbispora sp. NPDC049125]|uniref:D-alanyl-D-alanine carboxypeptidase family protein n=1 Tax=Microbispora sp. NPDC049125 TaxID=3154929 RepID=UPI00346615DE
MATTHRAGAAALVTAGLMTTVLVGVPSGSPAHARAAHGAGQAGVLEEPRLLQGAQANTRALQKARDSGTVGGDLLAGHGLVAPAGVRPPPKTEASAYVVADADTGAVLAAKDPHGHYMPASTLKTLTAVTLIPKLDPDRVVKPSQWACNEEGSAVGLVPKPIYKIDDLFRALLMVSGNDAADALAEANGSLDETLADMNAEARKLQAYDTVAKSPNGLDRRGQRSSAYDLALIARAGLTLPAFREYISTKTAKFPAPKGHYEIANHNKLLGKYKGMLGVKNGYTTKAQGSFVGAARRDGHTVIVVIMHHPGGFWDEVAGLLDWGFAARGLATPVGTLVGPAPSPTPSSSALAVRPSPTVDAPAATAAKRDDGMPASAMLALGGGVIAVLALGGAYGVRRRRRQS